MGLPLISVASLLLGVGIAHVSEGFANAVDFVFNGIIDLYGYLAPVAIYIILAPALTRLSHCANGFTVRTLKWFAKLRLCSCLVGIALTCVALGLPVYINGTVGLGGAILKALKSLGWMVTHSVYFYAVYAAIITKFVVHKFPRYQRLLQSASDGIEALGQYMVPLVPVFMIAIGSYIYHLPVNIQSQVTGDGGAVMASLSTLHMFGLVINPNTPLGMLGVYLIGAFLTAVACWIWQLGYLVFAKFADPQFSVWGYFRNYWCRVYPLLWATSSESLGTPLNLHLVNKYYPHTSVEVRRFSVGGGSFLSINGTLICVFVLAGVVCGILGIKVSLLQFLLALPIVFVMGYGVPGIPGELILFGGPMAILLGVPPQLTPIFLTLYVGLQIGLPDSFRTACNSTDNCISCLLLDKVYKREYCQTVEPPSPVMSADQIREVIVGGGDVPVAAAVIAKKVLLTRERPLVDKPNL